MPFRREASVALAIAALGLVLALAAPGFFARDNLNDLFLANLPVLIVALGMTLILVALRQVETDGKEYNIMLLDGTVDGKAVKGS